MIDYVQKKFNESLKTFDQQCSTVGDFLDKNPASYKTVLIVSHIFRAATMFAGMECLPLSFPASCALMLIPSLTYRASIERFCIFRFTLPSLAGGMALWAGRAAAVSLLAGTAFSSLGSLLVASLGMGCLTGYIIFICKLSHSDIEKYMQNSQKKTCCR